MKKILLSNLFILLSYSFIIAQDCATEGRYLEVTFASIDSTTVVYGENTTFNGVETELDMEIFYPTNDAEQNRPVLLMAHGGFFIAGEREDLSQLCAGVAHTGYVTASMKYRLFDGDLNNIFNLPDSLDMLDEVVKAVGDVKAAVRYLKYTAANGNPYQIDSNKIFIGGVSAGAIAAVNAAFMDETDIIPQHILDAIEDNGGLAGTTDHPTTSTFGHTEDIVAVVNLSGGIGRKSWLQGNSDVSIFSAHGDQDETVPYTGGTTSISPIPGFSIELLYLDGSYNIHEEATTLGLNTELYTVVDGGHAEFYSIQDSVDVLIDFTLTNLYPLICSATNVEEVTSSDDISIQPTISSDYFNVTWVNENVKSIKVISLSGKTIQQFSGLEGQQSFDINCASWAKGMYSLLIQTSKNAYSKKLIVK